MLIIGWLLIIASAAGLFGAWNIPVAPTDPILMAIGVKWAAAVLSLLVGIAGCVLIGAAYVCAEIRDLKKQGL